MNSPKPDAITESVEVSTVFYSFRLEWKIPSETILDSKHVPRKLSAVSTKLTSTPYDDLLKAGLAEMNKNMMNVPMIVENSRWFEFKDLKIHPFYLELSCDKCYDGEMPPCKIKVVTKDPNHAMRLSYALVCRGDRLYRLGGEEGVLGFREQEATLDVLRGICREQKSINVVCQITAESDVRSSSTVQCANSLENLTLECSLPSSSELRNFHKSSAEEAIDKYLISGSLPSLDVDSAQNLLIAASAVKGGLVELKALSAEFLTKHLDSDNVAGVWAFASEHRVQGLMLECARYMAKHWKGPESSEKNDRAMEQHKQKNFLFSNVYCK